MKWHKGKPPSIGWWPASVMQDERCIRWWSGENWSAACDPKYTAKIAAMWAKVPSNISANRIEWTDRWWEK